MDRRRALLKKLGLLAAAALLLDQLLLHLVLADGEAFGRRVAPYAPPLLTARQDEALARIDAGEGDGPILAGVHFDDELGWCPRPGAVHGPFRYDWAGARFGRAPLDPEGGDRRILVVGDSFVRGDEVAAHEAWPSLAEDRLDAAGGGDVVNHGVGAYGLDQVVLRLERDGLPLIPRQVWLGLFPQALTRVLSVYRPALQRWTPDLAFKPRFVLEGGALVLRPLPLASMEAAARVVRDQGRFLAAVGHDDHWIERDRAAYEAPWTSPWHWTALGRAWLTWRSVRPRLAAPLLADEGSELRRLAAALVRRARDVSLERGARLRVLVLPGRDDLRRRHEEGTAPWQGLCDDIAELGVEVLDLSDALERGGARTDATCWAPRGHYAPRAHGLVVEGLAEAGWIP